MQMEKDNDKECVSSFICAGKDWGGGSVIGRWRIFNGKFSEYSI